MPEKRTSDSGTMPRRRATAWDGRLEGPTREMTEAFWKRENARSRTELAASVANP